MKQIDPCLRSSAAERLVFTQTAVGASPTGGTTFLAFVAQQQSGWFLTRRPWVQVPPKAPTSSGCSAVWPARLVWGEKIGGSNPPSRTTFSQCGVTVSTRGFDPRRRGSTPCPGSIRSIYHNERP